MARLHQPSDVNVHAKNGHAARKVISILVSEQVADLRRDRCIVAKEAELVPHLITNNAN